MGVVRGGVCLFVVVISRRKALRGSSEDGPPNNAKLWECVSIVSIVGTAALPRGVRREYDANSVGVRASADCVFHLKSGSSEEGLVPLKNS